MEEIYKNTLLGENSTKNNNFSMNFLKIRPAKPINKKLGQSCGLWDKSTVTLFIGLFLGFLLTFGIMMNDHDKGYDYGKQEGQLIGYQNGNQSGYKLGSDAGFRQGISQGYKAGLKEGKQDSLSDPLDTDDAYEKGFKKAQEESKEEYKIAFNEGKIEGGTQMKFKIFGKLKDTSKLPKVEIFSIPSKPTKDKYKPTPVSQNDVVIKNNKDGHFTLFDQITNSTFVGDDVN